MRVTNAWHAMPLSVWPSQIRAGTVPLGVVSSTILSVLSSVTFN